MAKPTTVYTWAADPFYTSGPFPGTPTKLTDPFGPSEGSIPGEGVVPQFYNFGQNVLGQWTRWAYEGTQLPDLTAHVIESDSAGTGTIAAGVFGATASAVRPLTVTANAGFASATMQVESPAGGFGILSSALGSLAAVRGVSLSATGPALDALNSGGGIGLKAQCNTGIAGSFSATSGRAISASNTQSGVPAITGSNTGVGGWGVMGECPSGAGASGARGVYGYAALDGVGVEARSETGTAVKVTSASGNLGIFSSAPSGTAIRGEGSSGLRGYGSSGIGCRGDSDGSFGAQFGSTAVESLYVLAQHNSTPPLRIEPNSNIPGSTVEGNIFFHSGNHNIYAVTEPTSGGSPNEMALWGTRKGFTEGFQREVSGTVALAATTNICSASLVEPNEPRIAGYVEIHATVAVRSQIAATTDGCIITIWDNTSSIAVAASLQKCFGATLFAYPDAVYSVTARYLLPTFGPRTFAIRLAAAGLGAIDWENASISVRGVFDTVST